MRSIDEVVGVVGVALVCAACGGGDGGKNNGGGGAPNGGTVTDEWRAYCTGVFTKDYEVMDFGDPWFHITAGQEYLLSEYSDSFGPTAKMYYLWPGGPEEFDVEAATTADFPFTTTCPLNTSLPYYAVFEDVSVFAEQTLTTKLCDLKAGTALPRTSAQSGYSFTEINLTGPSTYEVYLNAFSAQCGGAATGYVSVPQVKSFTSNTWLIPIQGILSPK